MKRREFIAGLGSAAAWPLAARAQQPTLPVIGYIAGGLGTGQSLAAAFLQGLSETGYAVGRNVTIEYHWTEGHEDRVPAIINDLINRRVAVIAAMASNAAVRTAKTATQTIPIVFRIGGDPVARGYVPSLNRPGGNITGITTLGIQLGAKRLEILRELLPAGAAITLLANPTNPNAARETEEIQAAARILGIRLLTLYASSPDDIEVAFASIARQEVDGIMTTADPLFFLYRDRFIALVARRALPAIYSDRFFVAAGGLMSYGADSSDGVRLAGVYTGRILNGEKPADLPVQLSTKVELAINLKTAKALGLTFPITLLGRADEVIE
jgi:putative ABC transport system substrate-binding protein